MTWAAQGFSSSLMQFVLKSPEFALLAQRKFTIGFPAFVHEQTADSVAVCSSVGIDADRSE